MKNKTTILTYVLIVFLSGSNLIAQTSIPYYHDQADFLLAPSGAYENGLLGFVNPAVLTTLHGADTWLFFSDEGGRRDGFKRWGFFSALPNIGFGMIRHRLNVEDGEMSREIRITDYRVSFSGGSPGFSLGLGYGWSTGDLDNVSRDGLWTAGILARPSPYLSIGLVGNKAQHRRDMQGILDLALRPLGTDRLTLFSDFALQSGQRFKDGHWSVGAAIQPVDGIFITGRYFETRAFTLGLNFCIGNSSASAQTHVNKESDSGYTTYGIRLGAKRNNIVDTYFRKEKLYASMHLKGNIQYQKYILFDDGSPTLIRILHSLQDAADDSRVRGVALNLSGMQVSRELAWEIREKLLQIRKAGKRVIVYLDIGGMTAYHLASAADHIIMDPEGILQLEGYIMGRTYQHHLLEKLGLGFEEWRFFKYKSAVESFSRDHMSDTDRHQRQALLDDQYSLVQKDVCQSRNFSAAFFDSLINEKVIFISEDAIREGLVDTLGRWTNLDKLIESFEGQSKSIIAADHLANRILPRREWGDLPKVAVVYALGVCDMERGISARKLEKIIGGLTRNPEIRAVILRVDSPGGDGLASDLVAEAIRKCSEKKPVIISQGSVAASGGYWLSMYGDTVIAGPNTITGSIGVIGGWIWDKGFGEKLGLTSDYVKVGKHADIGFGIQLPLIGFQLPKRSLNEEERMMMEKIIRNMYKEFVAKVAVGRDMDYKDVKEIAQGRVWSGVDGREKGLVDIIGGLETAISVAKEAAGIPRDKKIHLVELPHKGFFNPQFLLPVLMGIQPPKEETDYLSEYIRMISEHPGRPLPILPPDMLF